MKHLNLEPILGSHDTLDSAEDYLNEVVFGNEATAVLTYGHMGALNLLQAAHTLNISIPERLSLMCFCDDHANRVMSPRLTFIDLCSEKMGKVAAELLLTQIENTAAVKPQRIVLEENLVVRNTTDRPFSNDVNHTSG
jgi:DNA-binding LacI/PurR family transcriptional regulator